MKGRAAVRPHTTLSPDVHVPLRGASRGEETRRPLPGGSPVCEVRTGSVLTLST